MQMLFFGLNICKCFAKMLVHYTTGILEIYLIFLNFVIKRQIINYIGKDLVGLENLFSIFHVLPCSHKNTYYMATEFRLSRTASSIHHSPVPNRK